MKKINLLLVGVLVSSLTFAGRRDESPRVGTGMAVVKANATSYKLFYKAEEAADVKVQIFNANDKLVFSETIKKSAGFIRPYNFESLAEGEYTIRIDNGSNWLTETVDYHAGQFDALAHLVSLKDGKYLLTVADNGEERLTVRIFNNEGQTLYTKVNKINGDFGQVYNLSQIEGPVTFEITSKGGASRTLK